MEDLLATTKYDYDFRIVRHNGEILKLTNEELQKYKMAAIYVSSGYKGPIWVSKLHMPDKPWRRVMFEEVQDLVEVGMDAHSCFLQLTNKSKNVWLITATPFPKGAVSLKANNELLGFKRLQLFGSGNPMPTHALPPTHPFERIKRKLYLRNPEPVRQAAISGKIDVNEVMVVRVASTSSRPPTCSCVVWCGVVLLPVTLRENEHNN